MSLFKKIFLYFPTLLGASMVLALPIGIIFTQAQYGMGMLESIGNIMDYFFQWHEAFLYVFNVAYSYFARASIVSDHIISSPYNFIESMGRGKYCI